jgi:ferredoxin
MLVINPDECIDCGVCEPECPAEAILPDTHPEAEKWLDLNRRFSEVWPNISEQIDPLPDADDYNPVKGYDADKTNLFDPTSG